MEESKSLRWGKLLSSYESSGLSQKTFCEQHGLKLSTFSYWRRALRRQTSEPGKFVEVVSWDGTERLEVNLPSGIVIRVPKRFDPASLKSLVEVLSV